MMTCVSGVRYQSPWLLVAALVVLSLPAPQGCKAELTSVVGYVPRWCLWTVAQLTGPGV